MIQDIYQVNSLVFNKGRHWKQKGPNKSGMYIRKHK